MCSSDLARLGRFRSEHDFAARLVRFRLSAAGAGLRPRAAVSPGWMQVTHQEGGEAFAAVLNADGSLGPHRVLVACNPHDHAAALDLPRSAPWAEVAVSPSPGCPHAPGEAPRIEGGRVVLPSMGAGVWSAGG